MATRLASAAIPEVDFRDPLNYAGVIGVLACVAVVASHIPARRATHIDPMQALKYE